MSKIMWQPTADQVRLTEMDKFRRLVNEKFNLQLNSYEDLHHWSVSSIKEFWAEMWNFGEIICSEQQTEVVDNLTMMPGAKWFSGELWNLPANFLLEQDNSSSLWWLTDELIFKECGYVFHFNAIPKTEMGRDANYWIKRTYEELYK